ncbi:hypothetical protein OIO90_004532 [Microbotryomycetes sp. JL221]|nr:hypothetical protein OIO90_004532 [Microbotryomycetes sp. JL221]
MHPAAAVLVVSALCTAIAAAPAPQISRLPLFNINDPFSCGSTQAADPTVEQIIAARVKDLEQAASGLSSLSETGRFPVAQATGDRQVAVHWHKILANDTVQGGNYDDSAISRQIEVLNEQYNSAGFVFSLASSETVTNADWYRRAGPGSAQQTEMKNALRKGDAASLNFYSVGFEQIDTPGLLGYATFPSSYSSAPKDDGVVFYSYAVPGGPLGENYSLGKVNTHEAGHWLGMFHTFQGPLGGLLGGCVPPGDSVQDTPPVNEPTFGCPTEPVRNCPLSPLPAQTTNIMGKSVIYFKLRASDSEADTMSTCEHGSHATLDYTYDRCKGDITPGQVARMQAQWEQYRA